MSTEPLYSGYPQEEDIALDAMLRPLSFGGFVGRTETVENLKMWIAAALARNESLDHVLFSGPPGLGKTTLAFIIARELGTNILSTSGPALERPRDLVGILTSLQEKDVLFIDEIHRINPQVEEYLYTAMEDFEVPVVIDPGPHSRTIKISLKPFTLVGATTRVGLLTAPLRSRFQISERLDFYTDEELEQIAKNSARKLKIEIEDAAARLIASRSRGTPRITNRFLKRIRDVAHARQSEVITVEVAAEGLRRLGVDEHGLCEMDRKILGAIARAGGRPVGLKTIAAVVGEQEDTIEDVYEPFLIRKGLLEKTPRGRVLTPAAMKLMQARSPHDGSEEQQLPLF